MIERESWDIAIAVSARSQPLVCPSVLTVLQPFHQHHCNFILSLSLAAIISPLLIVQRQHHEAFSLSLLYPVLNCVLLQTLPLKRQQLCLILALAAIAVPPRKLSLLSSHLQPRLTSLQLDWKLTSPPTSSLPLSSDPCSQTSSLPLCFTLSAVPDLT
jgi:hypothetical protein